MLDGRVWTWCAFAVVVFSTNVSANSCPFFFLPKTRRGEQCPHGGRGYLVLKWVRVDSSICELGVAVKVSEFRIYSLSTINILSRRAY